MENFAGGSGVLNTPLKIQLEIAQGMIKTLREPVAVVNERLEILCANKNFCLLFDVSEDEVRHRSITAVPAGQWLDLDWNDLIDKRLREEGYLRDRQGAFRKENGVKQKFLLNAGFVREQEEERLILLSFKKVGKKRKVPGKDYLRSFKNILTHAPAMICTLRGPQHVFELVNDRYLQLVGGRDVVGQSARKALPEVENQGFFEILDRVYETEEPFVGNELPIQLKAADGMLKVHYLDFLYHPTWDTEGKVDGIFVYAIDVTEQVLTRKKIEESEKELRKLIDAVPAIIWLSDKEGYSTYLNRNWFEYTGQSMEEAKGLGWLRALHPEDLQRAEKTFIEASSNQKDFSQIYRLGTKDGNYRWVLDNGRPRYGWDGQFEGMVGTVIDVHEEKVSEQQIREKEHRLRTLVEEATVATGVYIGREMHIEFANDAMIALWGKDRSVVGKTLREALPELEGQPFHDLLDQVYSTGKTYWGKEDRVDLMVNGKMQTGYFNYTYKPLRNEEGEIYGVLNMALDVTEMVKSKEVLRKSEARFRQLADLMPEKVAKTDPKGGPVYFNNAWIDYTGLSRKDLMDKGIRDLVHPQDKERFILNWETSLEQGVRFEMEFRCRNKKGSYKWHLSRAEAIRNEDGLINHWIISTTEIQKLKEEEKRKEDFLKMVSHELKTPVTSIKGYVQLLLSLLNKQGEDLNSSLPIKPSLERIDHQIVRLTRLISEMLDLSRIEENKLELQKSTFSLNKLVEETVQDIRYTNMQHQINLYHESEAEVEADRDRIGQVLINFITNAIKYSPNSREIDVTIRESKKDRVCVSVKDRGIGIDSKNHKKIFRRFYRIGGKEEEDTYSGFGIGLFLANEIIERHNGVIDVESSPGKGSTFSFTLDRYINKNNENNE